VSIAGGSGADTYSAGAGTDSFSAGSGANIFLFTKAVINGNAPQDVITGWQNADNVVLSGYGSLSNAVIATSSSGGNTTVTLSDNTTIKFIGVASAFDLGGHFTSS
jgi:Ca2+-binding RTX toxin-like protein